MTNLIVREEPDRAGTREWLGLAVLLLPCLLVSMDMSVLFFALPFISADLAPSGAQMLWIADIYGFLLAGLLVTMGTLGDRIGRRRLLLIGAVAFGAASALAAYAPSAELLIAARALLGIAGATLAPSTLSLIRTMFHDARQRTAAISLWTAGFAGGSALGPVVGGVLLEQFWWGSVFLINLPAMVLLLAVGPLVLTEHREPSPGRFDLLSAVLSLLAVLPVIYGFKQGAEDGFGVGTALLMLAGVGFGVLFVRRQRRPDPMIDLGLFRRREFGVSISTNMLTLFAMMGFALVSAQYLQLVLGMRPLPAALWSLPTFVAMALGTAAAAAVTRWVRPAFVVGGGLLVAAGGFIGITGIQVDSSLAVLVGSSCLMAGGIGAVAALATDLVLASAPREQAGAASALSETGSEFGAALGMAVLGTVGVAVYRNAVAGSVPAGLPPEAAAAANDTLGGAFGVASALPAEVGGPLMAAASEAFVDGMRVTAAVAAAVVLVVAGLATTLLRHVGAAGDPAPVGAGSDTSRGLSRDDRDR